MELKYIAFPVEYKGQSRLVIDDQSLLEWACDRGIAPCDAQAEALRRHIIPLRYMKNFPVLDFEEQLKICRGKVFICGCGGLGGILIDLLSRAGVGRLWLADKDIFFPTNLNRQMLSDVDHLSRPKVHVAEERVKSVNPFVEVRAIAQTVNEANVVEFIRGADLVLDALDELPTRYALADAARGLNIPMVHAAAAGWGGRILTLLPDSSMRLPDVVGSALFKRYSEEPAGVLGPAPAVIGSLEAFEALRILMGRKPAYADRLLCFDGESGTVEMVPVTV